VIPFIATFASALCMAAPIHHTAKGQPFVAAGPLTGYIAPPYDVFRGRFSLHVGPNRTPSLSQKIPWFVKHGTRVGATLTVRGRNLASPGKTFRQQFNAAYGIGTTDPMFPTGISPPSPGCWQLTFATGPVSASIRVWVQPRPS
jgi:hypothetical protein